MACACAAFAQPGEDPELAGAKLEIERLRALVDAGAASRRDLQQAEDRAADAEDAHLVRKSILAKDMTEAQAAEVVAAAQRRMERREKRLGEVERLFDAGAATAADLAAVRDEAVFARQQHATVVSLARLTQELAEMAATEELLEQKLAEAPAEARLIAERFDGDGVFPAGGLSRIEVAFEGRFHRPLPISALGETAVHRALGFDHRNRVDVAVHPDQPEGVWLRQYLSEQRVPYFAFRQAVPGKATGAHIHIGPMSTRLAHGG